VESFVSRVEIMFATDYGATSLLGPVSPPSQVLNADLANALYHFWTLLHRSLTSHVESIQELMGESIASARGTYLGIVAPLLAAIRRELTSIVTHMHRVDFAKGPEGNPMAGSGTSPYMKEFSDKLIYIRQSILAPFRMEDLPKEWALELAQLLLQNFLLHASIIKPISEAGKLKLTSDMTAMEFAVNQLLSDYKLSLAAAGDDFKALRAFRPLMFAETEQLTNPLQTAGIPSLILLHHVLVRSAIPLPHQHHGWSESEYIRWINEHGDRERTRLIEGVVDAWEKGRTVDEEGKVYLEIMRTLISRHV